jgi:Zn-dependent protease with chaperone function
VTSLLLVGFAAALAFCLPARLADAAWTARCPRLAILAWQATTYGVVVSLTLAALVALLHWEPGHDLACAAWRLCLGALNGSHGRAGQLVAWAGLIMLAALAVRLAVGWRRVVSASARARRDQLDLLRLAGTVRSDLDATVLPCADPAAYVVSGHRPHVVVTSGALARLTDPELAAVLAHERAHAAGRHHRLRVAVRLLHRAFPHIPAFAHATRQVDRLVELCADDAAARHHDALTLARALVAMATPMPTPEALCATGGDATERLRRLLEPPRPLSRTTQALAAIAWALLPTVPLAIVVVNRLVALSTHIAVGF